MSFLSPGEFGSIRDWLASSESKTIAGSVTFTGTVTGAGNTTAKYVTAQAESGLSNEVNLGALTTGILKHTVAAGVSTPATATAGTDYTSPSSTETMTNKTLTDPILSSTAASSTEGTIQKHSTQKCVATYVNGLHQKLAGVFFTGTADQGPTNTTTETTLIPSGVGTATLPANFFVAGKVVKCTLIGYIDSHNVSAGTLTLKSYLGGTGGTAMAITAANTMVNGLAKFGWKLELYLTCRTAGASGTVAAHGAFTLIEDSVAVTQKYWVLGTGANIFTSNSTAVTVDTTASQAIEITAKFGTAQTGNSIKTTHCIFEALN